MTIEEQIKNALMKLEPIIQEFYFMGIQKGWEIGVCDGKTENNTTCSHCGAVSGGSSGA